MKAKLSQKDITKLARYEASQGYSLSKIEKDLLKKGIERSEVMKALDVVDYYNKEDESKKKEEELRNKERETISKKAQPQNVQPTKKKSSFWLWIILMVLFGIIIYLLFSGSVAFDWRNIINFK